MSTYPLAKLFLKLNIGLQSEELIDSVLNLSQVLFDVFILDSIREVHLVADHQAVVAAPKQI